MLACKTYGKHHQNSNHGWLTDKQSLSLLVTPFRIVWIPDQAYEKRLQAADVLNSLCFLLIHVNKYHGKENDVDQNKDHNSDATPLEPENFADAAVDGAS